ncbi:MAG: mandelate racemase/muconate lactonizing enzyme family protein [Bryobacteraceae bacterium]
MPPVTRRKILAGLAAAQAASVPSKATAAEVHRTIGVPLKITKVEPVIIRSPNDGKPEPSYVQMTPLGGETEDIGIWRRLERAETSRQHGVQQSCLVKITTDQGVYGWGEGHAVTAPRVVRTILTDLFAPILIGQDARNIEPLFEKLYSTERLRGHNSGFWMRAIAAIDIALWDLVGKAAGLPVYQMLGGKFRDRIHTYQGVGGNDPAQVRDNVQRLLEIGYPVQKMSLAKGGQAARDFNRVLAAAEVLEGKGQILVDSLGAYTLHEATLVGRKMDQVGNVGWWEDVLMPEDLDGYARLADAIDVPICAGEQYHTRFDFRDLFEKRAADIVNPDPCRIGITECKRIAILADLHDVLWSPHSSMGSAPYRAAALHLSVSTPNAVILEGGESYKGPFGNRLLREPLDYRPGSAAPSDRPGLGVEFDEKELAKVTVRG